MKLKNINLKNFQIKEEISKMSKIIINNYFKYILKNYFKFINTD